MAPTVLIVDDHPSFRASARAILESDGFSVVGEAEDGASALTAARELKPDVVLLDVQLPDANGFDLCAFICEMGSFPDVVLVSSRDASDYNGLIDNSPARGFISKADLSGEAVRALLA
jgi:DNA-binding NarL/FixJ family response regulator